MKFFRSVESCFRIECDEIKLLATEHINTYSEIKYLQSKCMNILKYWGIFMLNQELFVFFSILLIERELYLIIYYYTNIILYDILKVESFILTYYLFVKIWCTCKEVTITKVNKTRCKFAKVKSRIINLFKYTAHIEIEK